MGTIGWVRLALVVAVAGVGACSTNEDSRSASASTSTSIAGMEEPLVINWTGSFETELPNQWLVRDCEGERTHACVYDGDAFLGDVELVASYPLEPDDRERDPQVVATEAAADMVNLFRTDRAEGCAAFTFEGEAVSDATVGGQPGARGGFTLTDDSGRVVERVINHYVVVGEQMSVINTDAYVEEGGCLGPSETDPSFTPDNLAEFEPFLDRLIADSPATA